MLAVAGGHVAGSRLGVAGILVSTLSLLLLSFRNAQKGADALVEFARRGNCPDHVNKRIVDDCPARKLPPCSHVKWWLLYLAVFGLVIPNTHAQMHHDQRTNAILARGPRRARKSSRVYEARVQSVAPLANTNIADAVAAWLDDEATAAAKYGDISSWDVSAVTYMRALFYSESHASTFNGDISSWDVSHVTDMSHLFHGATMFNGDISSWDVSGVTNMRSMLELSMSFKSQKRRELLGRLSCHGHELLSLWCNRLQRQRERVGRIGCDEYAFPVQFGRIVQF
jgi:surface protein